MLNKQALSAAYKFWYLQYAVYTVFFRNVFNIYRILSNWLNFLFLRVLFITLDIKSTK